ncbi:MAG: class I adenylate cyclase [Pseudomonadota bacterium]
MVFTATNLQRDRATIRPINLGSPGEDISVKDLNDIKHRFMHLHKMRLQRIQQALQPRQRVFLELLPLLFHCNYPALPGYVSSDTPAGIPDFIPGRNAIKIAENFSKSFVYQKRALRRYPIQGIYLMGSVASIAYSRQSDLDFWLCHQTNLSKQGLNELQQKAQAISKWAESIGLESHFFFIDTAKFAQGTDLPISKESSGSTQHYLLLEEFYRTSLYVAGRVPVWWVVPPHQESNYSAYVEHLKRKRFIDENETIDFGGLENVPADEFISATLWHLYKAIHAPHKSLLKLFLMESYASEYPDPSWLSLNLKQAVYDGVIDLDALDPYILMYKKVETYLANLNAFDRVELARHCFYLKINELLSVKSMGSHNRYRRDTLESLVKQWGWSAATIGELDDYKKWNFVKASREQKIITQELIQCYQLISQFALEHITTVQPDDNDIKLLGRKLNATLERRPGKIEVITATPPVQLRENDLSLHEIRLADSEQGWALYRGHIQPQEAPRHQAVKKTRSLIEILTWMVLNGLYGNSTNVLLKTSASALTPSELNATLQTLTRFLKKRPSEDDTLDSFLESSRIEAAALFINVARAPIDSQKDGRHIASSRSDALSYSSMRVNLVHTIDAVLTTSWHEVLCRRYLGLSGLFNCLCEIINKSDRSVGEVQLRCFSFTGSRARSIALRVKAVFSALNSAFSIPQDEPSPRFVIRGENAFFLFQRQKNALAYRRIANESKLYEELGSPESSFSSIVFEKAALDVSPLPLLYSISRERVIQVFHIQKKEGASVYILDERGSLFTNIHPNANVQIALASYALFLNAILRRYELYSAVDIEFYDIQYNSSQGYTAHEIAIWPTALRRAFNIRVTGEELYPGHNAYTLYCDDTEFSSMEFGDDLFQQAALHICRMRESKEPYPIYITDIDVPLSALGVNAVSQLQMTHFLRYKREIENRLNGYLPV